MKVLVTGAHGMVGRNLIADPGAQAYEILSPRSSELDLRDLVGTSAYLATHRPDAIVHLAAVVGGIQANIDEPVRFLVANTEMALSLFQAARENGVTRLLNVTSSCMYPRNMEGTLSTDMLLTAPLEPTNEGYALGKILSWKLLEYMSKEDRSLLYRTILPCNLFGLYDHFDPRKSHLVPAAIMKIVDAVEKRAPEVSVWGTGQVRREFMFAADLAHFIWWALPQLDRLPSALNVGLGTDWTVQEYYQKIAELLGYEGRLIYDYSKPEGMTRKLLDVSEITARGWRAPTSLEEGLQRTIDHYLASRRSH